MELTELAHNTGSDLLLNVVSAELEDEEDESRQELRCTMVDTFRVEDVQWMVAQCTSDTDELCQLLEHSLEKKVFLEIISKTCASLLTWVALVVDLGGSCC